MKRIIQLVLLLVFWSLPLHSQEVVQVNVGHGQVRVTSTWKKDINDQIVTYLLTDEELAPLVMGPRQVVVQLDIKDFPQVGGETQEIASAHFKVIKRKLKAKLKVDADDDVTVKQNNFKGIITKGRQKVVMGANEVILENEIFDEVTVLGGSLDVYGTIRKLVVLGGEVNLKDTAIIEEELNVIGGILRKDPGAQVLGKEVNMSWPLNESNIELIFDNIHILGFQWLESAWFKLIKVCFYIFVVLIFMFLANYIAPDFQKDVNAYLEYSPFKSGVAGLIFAFLTLPLTVFLVLSIVGLPLLPLQYSFLILFLLLGYGHVSEWLVNKIFKGKSVFQYKYVALVAGLLILELVSLLPMVGWTIKVLAILIGFGAVTKVFQTRIFRPGHHYFVNNSRSS